MSEYKAGEKVIFIPENEVYDFGYYVNDNRVVIYIEGCRNMQDSYSVELKNIKRTDE